MEAAALCFPEGRRAAPLSEVARHAAGLLCLCWKVHRQTLCRPLGESAAVATFNLRRQACEACEAFGTCHRFTDVRGSSTSDSYNHGARRAVAWSVFIRRYCTKRHPHMRQCRLTVRTRHA